MFGVQQTEDGGLIMAQNESAQELLLDVRSLPLLQILSKPGEKNPRRLSHRNFSDYLGAGGQRFSMDKPDVHEFSVTYL
jgi:hypothetical protein